MDKNKLMEQLRNAVREVIQEELGKSSYDAKSGISTTALTKDGKPVGYIKHKKTDTGLVAGGRIGPKAAKAVTAEEKITTNIPVAALPSYKKGEQPTVINPQTGEEEIESDVSSWAKALERRFGHLKPGETASLKGDPQDVKKKEREELDELNPQTYRDTAFIRRNQAQHQIGWSGSDKPDYRTSLKMNNRADDLDRHATDIENKRRAKVLSKDGRVVHGSASGATRRKFGIRGENVESYTLEEWIGMMEEAGYDTSEVYSLWRPKESGAKSTGVVKDPPKESPTASEKPKLMRRPRPAGVAEPEYTVYASNPWQKNYNKAKKPVATAGSFVDARNAAEKLMRSGQAGATRIFSKTPDGEDFDEYFASRDNLDADYQNLGMGKMLRRANPSPQLEESYTLEEWMGMMEEAGYSLEEGAMDTLRHAGRQVRDTVKGIGRAGKAVLAARRGGDAKSMMGLIGHDLKRAYQSPAVVHSTGYDGETERTSHGPGAANILRRLRDYGQDTRLFFGEREPKKFRHGADRTINQSPEEIERDATPRQLFRHSSTLPSRLAYKLKVTKERPDTSTNHYSTSESYTLEEWIGMMEEAGYSLQENDPYRDRNPNPAPEPGEIPQGHGGMIGYRGIPRGPAPKPDPYRDRNPNPAPEPGEIPQGAGGYHIEERNKENKAKKDAEIADTGWALRGQPGGAKGGTPNDELVKNKQRGRKDAKTIYGGGSKRPGQYSPSQSDLVRGLLKGYAKSRLQYGSDPGQKPNLPEENAHKPKLATSGGTKGPPPEKTKSKSSIGTRTGYGKDTPSYTKPNKK